eukprot:PITA_26284
MTVREYTKKFYKVSIRARQTQDTDEKVARYVNGLRMDIQDEISILSPKTVEESYQMVLKAKEKLTRKQSARGRGRGGRGRGREVRSYRCKKLGQGAFECPKNAGTSQRNEIVSQVEGEATTIAVTDEENIPERGEYLVVNNFFLKLAKEIVEPSQRKTLFKTVCKVEGKCCQMIIDSGITNKLVSTEVVEKLKLKTMKHPTPYKVSWLQKGHQLLVNEQCKVELQLGKYKDKIVCDVMPMDVCHMLL